VQRLRQAAQLRLRAALPPVLPTPSGATREGGGSWHRCRHPQQVRRQNDVRTPHMSCRKGKRVRVALHSGEVFVDKFVERRDRRIIFEGRTVDSADVKSFGLYKARGLTSFSEDEKEADASAQVSRPGPASPPRRS
jgi:hypothetical protein